MQGSNEVRSLASLNIVWNSAEEIMIRTGVSFHSAEVRAKEEEKPPSRGRDCSPSSGLRG